MESEPTAVLHPGGGRLIGVGSPPIYQTPKTNFFGGSRTVWTTVLGRVREHYQGTRTVIPPSVADSQLTLAPYV